MGGAEDAGAALKARLRFGGITIRSLLLDLIMSSSNKPKNKPIFTERFWDRPEPKPKGSDTPDQIFAAVGVALSQWELVDEQLANLFIAFTCEPNTGAYTRHAVGRSYGSIISTAGRRTAIAAAGEVYFPTWMRENEAEKDGLKHVLNAARWAAKLRDDVAHGVCHENIEVVTSTNDIVTKEEKFGSYLMPPEYNTGRTYTYDRKYNHLMDAWKAQYCYNHDDLKEINAKFIELIVAIHEYRILLEPYLERARSTFPIGGARVGSISMKDELDRAMKAHPLPTPEPGS